jgi:hypothetical protein
MHLLAALQECWRYYRRLMLWPKASMGNTMMVLQLLVAGGCHTVTAVQCHAVKHHLQLAVSDGDSPCYGSI